MGNKNASGKKKDVENDGKGQKELGEAEDETFKKNNDMKIILLGRCGAGKSTLTRQLSLLHDKARNEEEDTRLQDRTFIYSTIVNKLALTPEYSTLLQPLKWNRYTLTHGAFLSVFFYFFIFIFSIYVLSLFVSSYFVLKLLNRHQHMEG